MNAPTIDPPLVRSYACCARVARRRATNFYYALKLMPEPKRSAMYALYAWMRLVDDIADEADGPTETQRLERLNAWQAMTRQAAEQGAGPAQHGSNDPDIWPAVADMIRRYRVPLSVFDDAIEGQRQDLHRVAFEHFAELEQYCRRVAGTVGLASIHIWGFDHAPQTENMAVQRGIAFQLTNILRDVREDLGRGRIYFPRDQMRAAGVSEADLRAGKAHAGFVRLMQQQIARARTYYQESAPLEQRIERDGQAALRAMTSIYRQLLERIAAEPAVVLRQRVSLSWLSKLVIGWRALRG